MANDNRITRSMVVAENLVDRYLLGKMDESEAMAFEDFYASDPETLAELETSTLLIDGMQQAGRSGAVAAPTGAGNSVVPLRTRMRRMIATPAYGIAASIVAVAAVAIAVAGNLRNGPGGESSPVAATNFPVVTLAATRGDASGLAIDTAAAGQVVFVLDLGVADAPAYSAVLENAGGDAVWRAGDLRADALQSLTLNLPDALLPAGSYQFTVRPDDGDGDTRRFPFVINRK